MVNSFQRMTENRSVGNARARLMQMYRDQGYSPEVAAQKADAEMSFRDRQARIAAPEAGFTGQQGDAIERAAGLSAQEPGYYGQSGRTLQYSVNPRLLSEGEPAPQMDEFRETAPTPGEAARNLPQASSSPRMRQVEYTAETPVPFNPDFPALMQQPQRETYTRWELSPEAEAEREDERRRNTEQSRIDTAQSITDDLRRNPNPYGFVRRDNPDPVEIAQQVLANNNQNQTQTQTQGQTGNQPPAAAPAAAPAAGSQLTDRVSPADLAEVNRPAYAPIGQAGSLPMMSRIGGGAAPVAPNVQDRSVTPGLIAMAGDRIAPYSMQFSPAAMRFSTDKAPPARPAPPAAKTAAAPTAAAQTAQNGNFFTRLFSGPEVQSNNQALIQRQQGPMQPGQERAMTKLNVGNSSGPEGSAADFFRADKARQELEKSGEAFTTMKRGGAAQAPGKDAALHKALEIIHHMLTRGH
jgi:hypothetical protein